MDIVFLKQPLIIPIKESGDIYELVEDYFFSVLRGGQAYPVIIKKGFKYDGASVPPVLGGLVGFMPDGIHRPAALIHDYLYSKKGRT